MFEITVNLSSFTRNFSWKRIWIFETPVNPPRFSALALVPPFRAVHRAIARRGVWFGFQPRVDRERGRGGGWGWPGIIRLKFQRYLRRGIFSAPTHGLSERRVVYDGANIRRLTRKSLVPVYRLSSSAKRKIGLAGRTSTIDETRE